MSAIDELEKNWGSKVVLNLSEPKITTTSEIGNCTASVSFSAKPHWRSSLTLSNGRSISGVDWQFAITGHQDLEGSEGKFKWIGAATYSPASEFCPNDEVHASVSIDQRQLDVIISALLSGPSSLAAELELMGARSADSEVWNVATAKSLPAKSVRFRIIPEFDADRAQADQDLGTQLGSIRSDLMSLSTSVRRTLPWIVGLTAACAAALLIF